MYHIPHTRSAKHRERAKPPPKLVHVAAKAPPSRYFYHIEHTTPPFLPLERKRKHTMFPTPIRLAEPESYKPYLNAYKAKKTWPPDFSQLSQKHQFRLERRYRRRTKLAWARPRWNKMVKLATWGSISGRLDFMISWCLLLCVVGGGETVRQYKIGYMENGRG